MLSSSSTISRIAGSAISSRALAQARSAAATSRSRSCVSQVKPSPSVCHSTWSPKRSIAARSPLCQAPLPNCTTPQRKPRPSGAQQQAPGRRRLALALAGMDDQQALLDGLVRRPRHPGWPCDWPFWPCGVRFRRYSGGMRACFPVGACRMVGYAHRAPARRGNGRPNPVDGASPRPVSSGRRCPSRGSKGNAVKGSCPQSAAAPATVVGKPMARIPLGNREGGQRRRPESQETCRRIVHSGCRRGSQGDLR